MSVIGAADAKSGVTSHDEASALFPLPFTPFEYYYWSDDSPEYPKVFPVDLRFSGNLDETAFRSAVRAAQIRHPLLAALVDASGTLPRWINAVDLQPFVDWAAETVPITHPDGAYIDLRREVGLRVWVRTRQDATRVVLQIHHACCDGLGCLQFLEDLFLCYVAALGTTTQAVPLPALDAERLRTRGHFVATENPHPSLRIALRDISIMAWQWSSILLRHAAVLAAPRAGRQAEVSTRELFGFASYVLDGAMVRKLRAIASGQGATLNDLLLRDMLCVLREWNKQHEHKTRGRIRFNVPVSLREKGDEALPVTNRIGFAFVTEPPRNCTDPTTQLDAVRQEMERIKQWKLGLYFLGGLALATGVRGAVPWTLRRNQSLATMVLSNVGRAFANWPLARRGNHIVVGNVVLERITAVPPMRRLTRGGMVILDYADELTISLQCDPQFFDKIQTQELLDAYARQLSQTCERGT
jgi:WS/DGAT C-terminal domain